MFCFHRYQAWLRVGVLIASFGVFREPAQTRQGFCRFFFKEMFGPRFRQGNSCLHSTVATFSCASGRFPIRMRPGMSFSIRCGIAAIGCAFLAVICSCEKHHAGELPEHGEHDRAAVENKTAGAAQSPGSSATPTAAEFFPKK